MQENSHTFSEYFLRTDALAGRLGLNLADLPPLLGISKAMLYAYRAGRNRITPKAWHKLSSAEIKAGMNHGKGSSLTDSDPQIAETSGNLKEPEGRYHANLADYAERIALLETEMRIVKQALASLLPPAQHGGDAGHRPSGRSV